MIEKFNIGCITWLSVSEIDSIHIALSHIRTWSYYIHTCIVYNIIHWCVKLLYMPACILVHYGHTASGISCVPTNHNWCNGFGFPVQPCFQQRKCRLEKYTPCKAMQLFKSLTGMKIFSTIHVATYYFICMLTKAYSECILPRLTVNRRQQR